MGIYHSSKLIRYKKKLDVIKECSEKKEQFYNKVQRCWKYSKFEWVNSGINIVFCIGEQNVEEREGVAPLHPHFQYPW